MTLAFRQLTIDAPPFKPSAYGLLTVAAVREDAGLRPMAGGTFPSAAAGDPTGGVIDTTDCVSPIGGMAAKTANLDETWLDAIPVVAYGMWSCAPTGYTRAEAQDRAQTMFLAGESRELESVLWAYMKTVDAACTAATTIELALAGAEDQIAADYGGEGLIHVSRGTATRLALYVARQGSTLRTIACNTPVVVGDGYGDLNTIFATGAIAIARGPLEDLTPDAKVAVTRSTNDLTGLVERSYLVAVDGSIVCFSTT